MKMGQGVRTGLGHGSSPVSYNYNFLVYLLLTRFSNGKLVIKMMNVVGRAGGRLGGRQQLVSGA